MQCRLWFVNGHLAALETLFLACANIFEPHQNMLHILPSPCDFCTFLGLRLPSLSWPTPPMGLDKWLSLAQKS